ncbi:MAG TPA: hypothetical protein VFD84_06195 [Candidatus Binatia bacterium]|jgi:hypothetical protein|nr:hypothetical protein [Candidatus Binatia bacterium]
MWMRKGAVVVLLCGAFAARGHAHGVVGQRSFIEPFVTEDVNPKNEFVIGRPEWDHSREGKVLSVGFGLEKKISDRFSLTLDSSWNELSPREREEPHESGFDNLGITGKYAFWIDPAREAIASVALEATAPVGSADAGAEKDWSFKPFLLYGKGAGDLPPSLRYLRPFAVQGDAGFEVSIDHDRTTTFAHDIAIQYSIPYLQSFVRDFGLRWPLNALIAVTEFNFEHPVHGGGVGEAVVTTTPGVVYVDRRIELGIAGRFPLSGAAHRELDWGVIGLVDVFIDDLLPWTRWQPIGGMRPAMVPGPGAAP